MKMPDCMKIKEEERKPCSYLLTDSKELREAILEHPDYPILAFASEDANNGDWSTMSCQLSVKVGEFLNCQQDVKDDYIFTDRDEFEEQVGDNLYDLDRDAFHYDNEQELEECIAEIVAQYDEYWTPCIIVMAFN